MPEGSDKSRVNPGYVLDQLERALRSTGEAAATRVAQWRQIVTGMLDGTLRHGSRVPVSGTPAWVTLEVAHGGFATGRLAAGGELERHERELLNRVERDPGVPERAVLNAFYLSEPGRAELRELLRSRNYRVTVPEEGALPVVGWLLDQGEAARAERLLDTISPFLDRLRFYPAPAGTPLRDDESVYVQPAAAVASALQSREPKRAVETMKEAIRVWNPLYDRAVSLFLETVEGETPRLQTTDEGRLVRRADGNPVIEGGWPCAHFPDGWADRARTLLADHAEQRKSHRLSGKPEKPKENFPRLRTYLATAAENRAALSRRDVGMIRKILASFVTKHAEPGSSRLTETRRAQARNAALPGHHELARILATRLIADRGDGGVREIDTRLVPLSKDEARAIDAAEGAELPTYLIEKAMRCLQAPIETLVDRGVVSSSEAIATLLPHLTARTRAAAIEKPELRSLYAALYEAFRRRRSLLLLDLEHQVQLAELPWVEALTPWIGAGAELRQSARTTMSRAVRLAVESFPYTIFPNKLIRELRALAATAGERFPLVDELAADIFMGTFSASYLRAAQAAVPTLAGTLYARYYGLPLERVSALDDLQKTRYGTPESPGFATLCAELAGVERTDGWSVARNGMIIEQAQILTTHNLAQLITGLDLAELRPAMPDLSRRCFSWICRRQQNVGGDWHAEMQTVKNAAYAWRQMIFFLTLAGDEELQPFLWWAREHLSNQREDFRLLFEPALSGLIAIAEGREFDANGAVDTATGSRRFLGWTPERHWLLPETRRSERS